MLVQPMTRRRRDLWPTTYGRCRFCQATAPHDRMVHYAVRHWAHPVCLYKSKGIEAIDALHTWQIQHLPVLAMMEAGVSVEQIHAWQARIEAEQARLAGEHDQARRKPRR